jgi:hypothetical protein
MLSTTQIWVPSSWLKAPNPSYIGAVFFINMAIQYQKISIIAQTV